MGTELTKTQPVQSSPVHADQPPELPPPQIAALDALLAGNTVTDAAAAAGIGRTTIYKWLNGDCRFQAALNRGRRELQQAVAHRVDRLAADAADCVAQAVRQGNVKAAMEILKSLKVLAPRKIGSDDEVLLEIDRHEQLHKRDTQIVLSGVYDKPRLSDSR
jgi:hypothetical protein